MMYLRAPSIAGHISLYFPSLKRWQALPLHGVHFHVSNQIPTKWTQVISNLLFEKILQWSWFHLDLCVHKWDYLLDLFLAAVYRTVWRSWSPSTTCQALAEFWGMHLSWEVVQYDTEETNGAQRLSDLLMDVEFMRCEKEEAQIKAILRQWRKFWSSSVCRAKVLLGLAASPTSLREVAAFLFRGHFHR